MSSLFEELKRRNVFRVGIGYAVLGWVLMQIVDTMFPALKLPEWTITFIAALLLIGFPVALFLAWAFDLTPDGIKRAEDVQPDDVTASATRKFDTVIVSLLAIAVGYFAVEKYFVADSAEKEPVTVEVAANIPAVLSIAVLPFVNMSPDAEQEFFADGMTEEILNTLVKIPDLQVTARTSVFRYKGQAVDVREIGNALGVANILEGSVRKAGNDLRITAQLVRTSDGFHLWSDTYDRKLENVFDIQEDIAQRIAAALETPLGLKLSKAVNARQNVPLPTYEKYLHARVLHRRRGNYVDDAIKMFREVTREAPEFADGWAGLSLALEVERYYVPGKQTEEAIEAAYAEAEVAARKALELDPNSVSAHHAMANILRNDFQWARAEEHYEQGLAIDPDNTDLLEDYSELLGVTGHGRRSRAIIDRLLMLDPFVPVFMNRLTGQQVFNNDLDGALDSARRMVELDPESGFFVDNLLDVHLLRGEYDQALAMAAQPSSRYELDDVQQLVSWLQGAEEAMDQESARKFIRMFSFFQMSEVFDPYEKELVDYWRSSRTIYAFNDITGLGRFERANIEPYKSVVRDMKLPEYWRKKGWPDMCRPIGDDDFECGHFDD